MKVCPKCGKPLPAPRPGGQRRYCATCSPPRPDRVKAAEVTVLRVKGPVYDATLAQLTEVGLLHHWRGALLLGLAEAIDADAGSGSALAALVKEFQSQFTKALAGHQVVESPLDELRRRRQRKGRP